MLSRLMIFGLMFCISTLVSQVTFGENDSQLSDGDLSQIENHIKTTYKSKPGILGGTVSYYLNECKKSPDGSRIGFTVIGEDGHIIADAILCLLAEDSVREVARVSESEMQFEWIDNNRIIYGSVVDVSR